MNAYSLKQTTLTQQYQSLIILQKFKKYKFNMKYGCYEFFFFLYILLFLFSES